MSQAERVRKLKGELNTLVLGMGRVLDQLESIAQAADRLNSALDLQPVTVEPAPLARVPGLPAPPPGSIIPAIVAMTWLNQADEKSEKRTAYGQALTPGLGRTLVGVSLPARVPPGTTVSLRLRPDGEWLPNIPVVEVGPWSTRDPYWRTQSRPRAESLKGAPVVWNDDTDQWELSPMGERICNGAGIDVTPAVAARLTQKPVEPFYLVGATLSADLIVHEPAKEMLSPHFARYEAADDLPNALVPTARRLAEMVLEPMRAVVGPFTPVSWYRSEAHNAATPGASPTSAHLRAAAADVPRTAAFWRGVQALPKTGIRIYVETTHYHCALDDDPARQGIHWQTGVETKEWER